MKIPPLKMNKVSKMVSVRRSLLNRLFFIMVAIVTRETTLPRRPKMPTPLTATPDNQNLVSCTRASALDPLPQSWSMSMSVDMVVKSVVVVGVGVGVGDDGNVE